MPTPPTLAINDYFDELAGLLSKCGLSYLGSEHLTDAMTWPRYTFVLASESWSPDYPVDPETTMGSMLSTFVIHVYGKDFTHAYRLRQALLTALRQSALGSYNIGSAEWPLRDKAAKGVVVLQTVSIVVPIPIQDFPSALGDEIVDHEPVTAKATSVGAVPSTFDH